MRRRPPSAPPRRIRARFAGSCARCHAEFPRGTEVFWYPVGNAAYPLNRCGCGETAEADWEARLQDEQFEGAM